MKSNFQSWEWKIEKVASGPKKITTKVKHTMSALISKVMEHPLSECYEMANIPAYDEKIDSRDHLDNFKSWMLLHSVRQ